MRKMSILTLGLAVFAGVVPASAQQACPGLTVVVNSPEDQLMLAVNGADNPQDQIAALDKYAAAHANAPAMTCANELYTAAYAKQNDFAKAISYGEKDVAANYLSVNLIVNLMKAYVGAGQATENAFALLAKAPQQIKAEANPARPANANDAEWKSNLEAWAAAAKDQMAYMNYAFFALLARVTDPSKRIQYLDSFTQAYPDSPDLGQAYTQYLVAYTMLNNSAKADEYGEKAIAADPNNVSALNLVADNYATRRVNLDKAEADAKKVLNIEPNAKKPDGVSDADFQKQQNTEQGAAHLTLGYIEFQRAGRTRRVAGAIEQFKTAVNLLSDNPNLQARALYYLANAYEFEMPPEHRAAAAALEQAVKLDTPWQSEARSLLAKIPR
jgi:tetratricopeptide (TPR) repeat protein